MTEEAEADIAVSLAARPPAHSGWRPVAETIGAVVVVVVVLGALKYGEHDHEYQTNWIIIAILPIVFWLLFSGRITGVKAFGVELKTAIREASQAPVVWDKAFGELVKIEFDAADTGEKGGVNRIQSYKKRRLAALSFELGRTGYYDPAVIRRYLDELAENGSLRWVIFQDEHGRFEGLIPVQSLRTYGELTWEGGHGYSNIRDFIEGRRVEELPGFIGAELALTTASSKGEAISRFSHVSSEELPVIDRNGKFAGVVQRGKLHSGLLDSIIKSAQTNP